MSRRWIAGVVAFSCASLVAFASLRGQGAPKGAPAMAPNAWVITFDLSKWDTTKSPDQQPGFAEHHANVMKLAKEGTLLLGGPFLGDAPDNKPTGAMMIVKAANAEAAKKLVADDPIVKNDLMKIASVRGFLTGAGAWMPAAPALGGDGKH